MVLSNIWSNRYTCPNISTWLEFSLQKHRGSWASWRSSRPAILCWQKISWDFLEFHSIASPRYVGWSENRVPHGTPKSLSLFKLPLLLASSIFTLYKLAFYPIVPPYHISQSFPSPVLRSSFINLSWWIYITLYPHNMADFIQLWSMSCHDIPCWIPQRSSAAALGHFGRGDDTIRPAPRMPRMPQMPRMPRMPRADQSRVAILSVCRSPGWGRCANEISMEKTWKNQRK